jgi:hypothetical protein
VRTRQARRHPDGKFTRTYERLPGSPHPFARMHALLEDAKKAAKARQSALERLSTVFNRGFWKNLMAVLFPKLEAAEAKILAGGKAEYTEQDAALLKALRRLREYKSRGHGRGGFSPRFGSARSKYKPHQSEREMQRRRGLFDYRAYAPAGVTVVL